MYKKSQQIYGFGKAFWASLALLSWVAVLPLSAHAAGSFDTSGSNNASQDASLSLTAAESGEIAVMCVSFNSSFTANTPTVGGSSTGVTQIGTDLSDGGGGTIRMYYKVNVPTSATTYAVHENTSDGINLMVSLYKGLDTTSVPDSTASNTNSGGSALTLTTTVVAANSWLVSCYDTTGSGSNSNTAGTGTTIRQTLSSFSIGDSNGAVAAGSRSMGWDGARVRSAGRIASFAPLVAPTPSGGSFELSTTTQLVDNPAQNMYYGMVLFSIGFFGIVWFFRKPRM